MEGFTLTMYRLICAPEAEASQEGSQSSPCLIGHQPYDQPCSPSLSHPSALHDKLVFSRLGWKSQENNPLPGIFQYSPASRLKMAKIPIYWERTLQNLAKAYGLGCHQVCPTKS